jgi:hypothetical protein
VNDPSARRFPPPGPHHDVAEWLRALAWTGTPPRLTSAPPDCRRPEAPGCHFDWAPPQIDRRHCGADRRSAPPMTSRPRHNRRPAPALKRNAVILQRCWWISSARPRSRARLDPEDMREVILAYQNTSPAASRARQEQREFDGQGLASGSGSWRRLSLFPARYYWHCPRADTAVMARG